MINKICLVMGLAAVLFLSSMMTAKGNGVVQQATSAVPVAGPVQPTCSIYGYLPQGGYSYLCNINNLEYDSESLCLTACVVPPKCRLFGYAPSGGYTFKCVATGKVFLTRVLCDEGCP